MNRQFVAVQFSSGDRKSYTYHNDGRPVAKGDRVLVPTSRGQTSATVVRVFSEPAPPFQTKAIAGQAGQLL